MSSSEIWREVAVITEGEAFSIGGLNPWQHSWVSLGRQKIVWPNLVFPNQEYERYVYEIQHQGITVRFSAEEVSANVWRFLAPAPPTGA